MATPPSEGADKLDGSAKELRELSALRGELQDRREVQAQREGAEQAQAAVGAQAQEAASQPVPPGAEQLTALFASLGTAFESSMGPLIATLDAMDDRLSQLEKSLPAKAARLPKATPPATASEPTAEEGASGADAGGSGEQEEPAAASTSASVG